ncbi:MAG: helix-hairpin-helix domain-containing protein [Deltaproteobacteria bacterium]|nr:helix-hairpin-helix domain-containing protein [Deltaproteobacteria bacterium]
MSDVRSSLNVPLEPLTIQEKILFGFPLSINRLSAEEWEVLPGIGPKMAQKIVAERLLRGPFIDIDSLSRVRGMGPKTLEHIEPMIRGVSSSF